VTAIDETSSAALDIDVLATASREGRILITEDRGFGKLASIAEMPGDGTERLRYGAGDERRA
jgi:predicted nuclease of predicted toxin-antitoxin system